MTAGVSVEMRGENIGQSPLIQGDRLSQRGQSYIHIEM